MVVGLALAGGVEANGICADLLRGGAQRVAARVAVLTSDPGQGACEPGGGGALSCRWDFALRDKAATRVYAALAEAARECAQTAEKDVGVNHPDSYDAVSFRAGEVWLRLSLKDKSALGLTILFLQRSPAAD